MEEQEEKEEQYHQYFHPRTLEWNVPFHEATSTIAMCGKPPKKLPGTDLGL